MPHKDYQEHLEADSIGYQIRKQKEYWPQRVKDLDEQAKGKRFKSEILSYTDLWNLYIGGVSAEPTEEEASRGKKKQKIDRVSQVIPAKAFELPGRFNTQLKHHAKEGWGYLTFDQWLYARDQARKELYWFCKEVFGMDMQPHVHQIVCDQFVQKNFDELYKDGYTLKDFQKTLSNQNRVPIVWVQDNEYDPTLGAIAGRYISDPIEIQKRTNFSVTMILLDPRGFFKSSIDAVDCIQWIVNCPDIRILIVSGVNRLADQFLTHVKQGPKGRSFYLPKGVPPEAFHLLFPEFVIRGIDGTSNESLRIGEATDGHAPQKFLSADPTLGIISVGSSLSGFHCDVLKFDDIVTDDNCLTENTRAAILLKADGAVNMLMGWGWHDVIGTRYFVDDYYGQTEAKHKESPEDFNLKFFQRACWTVKDEYKDVERRSLYELTEEMVNLTFPELVAGDPHKSWVELKKKLKKNEISFRCFPAGSRVLMSDWTEKAIEDIKPGDEVIGFDQKLKKSVVSHAHVKRDAIIKAITNSGRVIFATKEHEFLRPINRKRREYGCLKIGAGVVSVYIPSVALSSEQQRAMDWLSGIIDGEGTCGSQVVIYQSEKENPEMCERIRERLNFLGISFEESIDNRNQVIQFKLAGGRSFKIRLLQQSNMVRKQRFVDSLWDGQMIAESSGRRGGSSYEKIVSIEEIGEQVVYDLTTETSNYVCQGFAVHNCQQLNQPAWDSDSTINFERVLLETQKSKLLSEVLVAPGTVYGAIDLARENKQFSDFTAIAVGKVYQEGALPNPFLTSGELANSTPFETSEGKYILVVLDVEFGKWSQTEIANRIAAMNDRWRPKQWYGEDIGGLILLKEKISDVSNQTYGHRPFIMWREPENSDGAKRNRVKGLEVLLRAKRLFFLLTPKFSWNDVFEHLERYKGQKSTRYFKDDVPDVLAHLARFVPSLIRLSKKELEEQAVQKEAAYREQLRREMNRLIFGKDSGGFITSPQEYYNSPPQNEPKGPMGNIGNKFFGNNGMRA